MSTFILDGTEINSHRWERAIPAPLSRQEHRAFQRELNKLVGVESDGTERLKLIWMPSFERWDIYQAKWIPFRCVPAAKEIVPTEGGQIVGAKFDYVGVPRYAVVGRVPEASRKTVEERKEGFDADGTHFAADRTQNEYTLILPIWEHDPRLLPVSEANECCAEISRTLGKKCWGKYRPPDAADLLWLKEQMALLSSMLESRPHEPGTERDRARMAQHLINLHHQRERKTDVENDYIIQSELFGSPGNRVYSLPN